MMEVQPFHIQLNTSDEESESESQYPVKPTGRSAPAGQVLNYPVDIDVALHLNNLEGGGGPAMPPTGTYHNPALSHLPAQHYGTYNYHSLANASGDYLSSIATVQVPRNATVMPPEMLSSINDQVPDLLQTCSMSPFDVADSFTSSASTSSSGSELHYPGSSAPMVYPMVYVSPAGLLTVLLRFDVAVEMTTDRTIRVVNHRHKSVAATNSRGNASCIYHTAAKIYQEGTTTEVDVYWERRAKMTTETMVFASGPSCYTLAPTGLCISHPTFSDLTKDMSVTLLFSSSGYGPHLMNQYERIAKSSKYHYQEDGGFIVFVNGVKIQQTAKGDVVVTSGPKTIRASPIYGSMHVETHFVEMAIEMNWSVKVRRGGHRLHASFIGFVLTDGFRECGFDQYRRVFDRPLAVSTQTIIRKVVTRAPGRAKAKSAETVGDKVEDDLVITTAPYRDGAGSLLSLIGSNGGL